jgi:hypothetical protein
MKDLAGLELRVTAKNTVSGEEVAVAAPIPHAPVPQKEATNTDQEPRPGDY